MIHPAVLVLEDGTVYKGRSIGASGKSTGEVVFNTSMTGYQEILTDPSYARQLVTLTYPHIGNTGTTDEDEESRQVFSSGLIIRDLPSAPSNFRSQSSLADFLAKRGVVAIADIDTRALTRRIRQKGAMAGCILTARDSDTTPPDIDEALLEAKSFPGLAGMDLAREVTIDKAYAWHGGTWKLGQGYADSSASPASYRVVAYDFGVKRNILRLLADRGCEIEVVPAMTSAADVMEKNPDGIFLSNGPGDPEPCDYAIEAIKEFLHRDIPVFGICLGHQLLGLAAGARTMKMKFGHHGANHPVQDVEDGRVYITSQNHGFAVDDSYLPDTLKVTHRSLFDGSVQGLASTQHPAFSFQGHPEASPGPHDIINLFDRFIDLMREAKQNN